LHIPVLGFWKNEHRFPYLKAAAGELDMTAISAPSERVFGVAATMLRRPEPTKEGGELTILSIKAIRIHLDQIHSAIAVTTSTNDICGVITTPH